MKRFIFAVLFLGSCFIPSAWAGVNVDINLGAQPPPAVVVAPLPPPPLQYGAQPDLIVVPGATYVYMVPGTEGMYFYQGAWFRYYNGYWYRSSDRAWAPVRIAMIPPAIITVPPTYALYVPADYYRIHYADHATHWKEWDRTRSWDRQPWYRAEATARQQRLSSIERDRVAKVRGGKPEQRHDEKRGHEEEKDRRDEGR